MSGLRPGQSVKTMTCTSERSGIASRPLWRIDHTPAAVAKSTSKMTKKRLRALASMIRSIIASTRHAHGELAADGGLSRRLDLDDDPPRSAHRELRLAFVDPGADLGRLRLLDGHSGHVHRVVEADGGAGDRIARRVAHADADRVLTDLGRPASGERGDEEITEPLLLGGGPAGFGAAAHVHRPSALHFPIAHADRSHHSHHAFRADT